ncbi:MAG TPA: hypothetical protein VHM90_01745, partial [Phycisphaerae bacterium]|nr:hypothetical protein [Phycisphaerae bacterium]
MKAALKWRWAYVPVIVVLGFIWYEFWSTGMFKGESVPLSQGTSETQPIAETEPATTVAAATTKAAPVLPPEPVLDPFDQLLKEPPPISVSVQNVNLRQAIDALNKSMGLEIPITYGGGGQDNKLVTLEMKDKPFWDVFEALEAQAPFEVQDGRGMRVVQYGQGIRTFERHGPVMVYATQFSYVRSNSGQMPPGNSQPGRMQMTLMTAIDPRVHVIRHAMVNILAGEDDLGQAISPPQNMSGGGGGETNCWQQTLTWPAPEKMGKKLTKLELVVQYTAQGGETQAAVEDIENKKDQAFDFGERRLRLVRAEVTNKR